MKKRIVALLLSVCMAASLLAMPAGAANTTVTGFSDVTDGFAAANVECLRLLGVLDGYADGTFRPDGTLTRAQFCKMAVYVMNKDSELGKYRTVTVFPDVKPSYWGAAYINLAAKGAKIIGGYPDGKFYPNRTVTYGQAVSILTRLLGYTDEDVGGIFPDGYIAQAQSIGLADGLKLSGGTLLTRGQAAKLFTNLLTCNTKEKGSYASTIATTVLEDQVLVSSSATAPDGSSGAMEIQSDTSGGKTYKLVNGPSSGALNGRTGNLLLDKAGRVLTFVPTTSGAYQTVTVSLSKVGSMSATNGVKYLINGDTPTYLNGEAGKWAETYMGFLAGTSVTLYFGSSGNVEYVFSGSSLAKSTRALVVKANGSAEGLSGLAGRLDYTICKNGVRAVALDLRQNDVVTYDSGSNSIRVCDTRVTGYYENAYPNLTSPTKVTVLGHEFPVLASGSEMLSKFKLGDKITLLLTEDNQVGGAIAASGSSATMLGQVTAMNAGSATVKLLCGVSISGEVAVGGNTAAQMKGQLVTVTSGEKGQITVARASSTGYGALDVGSRKLGSRYLEDNVKIFERAADGSTVAIGLSQLSGTVDAGRVLYAHVNWEDCIDVLLLDDVTGQSYVYGRTRYNESTETLSLEYGNGQSIGSVSGRSSGGGKFVGWAMNGSGEVRSSVELTKLSNVANTAWDGKTEVFTNGKLYTVSEDVVCYNRSADTWLTLSAAKAYASASNLYADSGNVIRVMEVW